MTIPNLAASLTKAQRDALKWIKDRGGSCAFARLKTGGAYFLAQGETGPFTVSTAKALVEAGFAYYETANGKKTRLCLKEPSP